MFFSNWHPAAVLKISKQRRYDEDKQLLFFIFWWSYQLNHLKYRQRKKIGTWLYCFNLSNNVIHFNINSAHALPGSHQFPFIFYVSLTFLDSRVVLCDKFVLIICFPNAYCPASLIIYFVLKHLVELLIFGFCFF